MTELLKILADCDKNIVKLKSIVIQGKECVVSCYPMVKDNPQHYQDRKQLVDDFNKKRKHKLSRF